MNAGPAAELLAELADVQKHFGQTHALRGVDLQIHPGEVLALLGPNGAGKTTAISIILGLRRPERGQVRLLGTDPRAAGARRRIGATAQETGFPSSLKAREVVELVRAHYEHPRPTQELLAQVGLVDLQGARPGD